MSEKTIHEALTSRRSIRQFSSQQIPIETIKEIVKDAQWTPSWANAQPWKLYVATNQTAKEIKEDYASGALETNIDMPSFSGEHWGMQERQNMSHWGDQIRGFLKTEMSQFQNAQQNLFDAPTIAIITVSKNAPIWEIYDAGAFEQSLLLSAYDHGVDSIVAVAFVTYADYLHQKLAIPEDESIVMGIGLGYRSDEKINTFKSDRVPLEEMLVIKD